ncbi:MAG: hypothetical protein GY846_19875 [Deltaproteobacteria bacterium]|nr:hypothetical protein [Deltaproteobacteria bacterium]
MKEFKFYAMVTFLAVFGLNCSLPVFADDIFNRIVAVVNDEVITLHELNRKIRELTGVEASVLENQDREGFIESRRKVLDLLIDEKIAQDKIKELGIEVTSREVDAAIERIKKRNSWTQEDLTNGLNKQGISIERYRENIKNELEQMRLVDFEVKSKIIVLDETIKKYYDDHIDEFKSEEKVRIAIILLEKEDTSSQDNIFSLSQKTEEIISRLDNGEDFGELARKFSKGPGAESGGDLGFIRTSQLDPKLKEIINNMNVGDVSKPIIGPTGIQLIKLMEKKVKGVKTVEEVKDSIYDVLYSEEISERYSSWIKELRDKAYIKIIF